MAAVAEAALHGAKRKRSIHEHSAAPRTNGKVRRVQADEESPSTVRLSVDISEKIVQKVEDGVMFSDLLYNMISDVSFVLLDTEECKTSSKDYRRWQPNMTSLNRILLLDWLVMVAEELGMDVDIFQTAVIYIDRCLSLSAAVDTDMFQLLGVVALTIASKVHTRRTARDTCLTVSRAAHLTDGTYTVRKVERMEVKVLELLEWSVYPPTPSQYLFNFSKYLAALVVMHIHTPTDFEDIRAACAAAREDTERDSDIPLTPAYASALVDDFIASMKEYYKGPFKEETLHASFFDRVFPGKLYQWMTQIAERCYYNHDSILFNARELSAAIFYVTCGKKFRKDILGFFKCP